MSQERKRRRCDEPLKEPQSQLDCDESTKCEEALANMNDKWLATILISTYAFPTSIVELICFWANPTPIVLKRAFEKVAHLSPCGLEPSSRCPYGVTHSQTERIEPKQVYHCIRWIAQNEQEINPHWEPYSYSLKHKVEKEMGMYVSHGAMIAAAIGLGNSFKKESNSSNVYFPFLLHIQPPLYCTKNQHRHITEDPGFGGCSLRFTTPADLEVIRAELTKEDQQLKDQTNAYEEEEDWQDLDQQCPHLEHSYIVNMGVFEACVDRDYKETDKVENEQRWNDAQAYVKRLLQYPKYQDNVNMHTVLNIFCQKCKQQMGYDILALQKTLQEEEVEEDDLCEEDLETFDPGVCTHEEWQIYGRPHQIMLSIEYRQTMVGFVLLRGYKNYAPEILEIFPPFRRRGLARIVMYLIEKWCIGQTVSLHNITGSSGCVEFFESIGYVIDEYQNASKMIWTKPPLPPLPLPPRF